MATTTSTRLSPVKLFIFIFAFRLLNSLTIQTFFQADEFFQALEPAHHFVYGYGYLTWEWKQQLRSAIHPLIYAVGYKLAGDNTTLVHVVPKIISALIATIGEYNLYKFVEVYKNEELAWITLMLSLFNPFNWYVSTRSFSNNLETVLTVLALRYWPWDKKISKSWYLSLAFGLVSCIIRPTNVLIWTPLGIWLLANTKITAKWILLSIVEVAAIMVLNTGLDYYFYQQHTFPLYNFLEFNVIKNLSIFYGTAPWHFYVFQAIPLMLMLYLPLTLYGLEKSVLLVTGLIYLIGFSLIQHKEFRFIYPLHPIMLYFTARGYHKLKPKYVIVGIFVNILIGLFFTNVHERGVLDVAHYLQDSPSIGFITPCHSTPWQSYFHNPELNAWFLTCEPPLHLNKPSMEEIRAYRDESDQFYDSPKGFLDAHLGADLPYPEHLVVFEPLEGFINEELGVTYHECKRFFNSYFHWDSRRNGDVIVFCKNR
ncbi:GPI mannosyltransferase 3 [Candida viswanathii]|uniref:Mannosyltransferase n=1 Tax=Candida viswanathii TaxID=5486 RepID=A0A367YGM9_9ASCO|nr:GPI mannosyltransferase 3 [Candida viswanathii]